MTETMLRPAQIEAELRYLPPDQRWGHAAWQLRAAYEQATKLQYE